MSGAEDVHRDLGRHDAEIGQLQADMQTVLAKLDDINKTLNQAKGGWRTLMLVGGGVVAVGAGLAKLWEIFDKGAH